MFNSFQRALSRNLRTLIETVALNMLLRGDVRKARDDLLDIALSLPFQVDTNTGFGILAKVYLDALTHLNGRQRVTDPNAEGVKDAKEMALEICDETFTGVKSPRVEVERGFRFWDVVSETAKSVTCGRYLMTFLLFSQALTAIRTMHSEGGVMPELAEVFEAADAWLQPMRP